MAHYTKLPLLSGSIQLIQNVLHTAYEIHWENMFWWRTLSKHQLNRSCLQLSMWIFFNLTVAEWVAQGSGQHTASRPGRRWHIQRYNTGISSVCWLLVFRWEIFFVYPFTIQQKLNHVMLMSLSICIFLFFGTETLSYETQLWYFLQKHNTAEHFFKMLSKVERHFWVGFYQNSISEIWRMRNQGSNEEG